MSIPAQSGKFRKPIQGNPFLNDNDDEEGRMLAAAKGTMKTYKNLANYDKMVLDSHEILKKKFPMGGMKASRFITFELLMKIDYKYFEELEPHIEAAVNYAQNRIADEGKSDIISAAANDPTDEHKQEEAFTLANGYILDYLNTNVKSLNREKRLVVQNLGTADIIGFSRLDPLWRENSVDEIMVNGPKDIQVEIRGRLMKVPGCKFRDMKHLKTLIERIYGAIGKVVSRTNPIVDGRLHDFSRLAVSHEAVSPAGPNLVIRRHREGYIPATRLLNWNSASEEMLVFLGNLIHKGASILVVGGTGSGKTTLLGALTGYIRNTDRIMTLEDNLELKLPPHKLAAAPMECIDPKPDAPGSGVDMRALVKASLRMRPNAIIVGEVRDEAAYDLCQALNTGHYGMSTVHANSEQEGVKRLASLVSQTGQVTMDAALPLIASSFDFIVMTERMSIDDSRKITGISEVSTELAKNDADEVYLPTRKIWKFVDQGTDQNGKLQGTWEKVAEISQERSEKLRLHLIKDLSWVELKKLAGDKEETKTHNQNMKHKMTKS